MALALLGLAVPLFLASRSKEPSSRSPLEPEAHAAAPTSLGLDRAVPKDVGTASAGSRVPSAVDESARSEAVVDEEFAGTCRVTVRLDRAPPRVLDLTLQARDRRPVAGTEGRGSIGFDMGEPIHASLSSREHIVEVPRAEYGCLLEQDGVRLSLASLDATGASATLELGVPDVVRVSGTIEGSMRGPLADLWLSFASEGIGLHENDRTDAAGRFELDLPVRGPIRVQTLWPRGDVRSTLWPRVELEPTMDPASPSADYVVPEALLRIAEQPPSPLLSGIEVDIRRVPNERDASRGAAKISLGDRRYSELHLPPGEYVVRRRLDVGNEQSYHVVLEENETRDLVLDCAGIAVLALDIDTTDPGERELRIRVRDEHGDIVDFARFRRLRSELHAYREVVEPGTYSVEVELHRKAAGATDEALDAWASEVTALSGTGSPLRVVLR